MSSVQYSTSQFAVSGSLYEEIGIPWGFTFQPFGGYASIPYEGGVSATEICRCKKCYAYFNPYCQVKGNFWICSLCGKDNQFTTERYKDNSNLQFLPEVCNPVIDFNFPKEKKENSSLLSPSISISHSSSLSYSDVPIYIVVIDMSQNSRNSLYYQTIQQNINALLEAIPENALFGLITFSDRVGVWDLLHRKECDVQHVFHIPIPSSSKSDISINQIINFSHFLVPVHENIVAITNVVNLLPTCSYGSHRGFGATVSLLVDYFSSFPDANVKIISFISGRPNYGIGSVLSESEDKISPVNSFYKEVAKKAVAAGVSFDLICFYEEEKFINFALPTIKFLSMYTGGHTSLYQLHEDDLSSIHALYKRYASEQGFSGVLRIRTSPEYKVIKSYGSLLEDKSVEGVYFIQSCDPWKTFSFDLDFTTPYGFQELRGENRRPTLQIAFAFNYLPGKEEEDRSHLHRRLRVYTLYSNVITSYVNLFECSSLPSILSLLYHKMVISIFDQGKKESRILLNDWLTYITSKYNQLIVSKKLGITSRKLNSSNFDIHFQHLDHLKELPRFIFALSKSFLFSTHLSPDRWTSLHLLHGEVEGEGLMTMIYPRLSSYSSVDTLLSNFVYLSKNDVTSSDANLFLLDCFDQIIVYNKIDDQHPTLFPLPNGTYIMNAIEMAKDRMMIPKILYLNSIENHQYFESKLIEDESHYGQSFNQFLDIILNEISSKYRKLLG